MGCATKILVKYPTMEVSNLLESLRFGVPDFHLFSIPGIMRSSAGEAVLVMLVPMVILVPVISLEAGMEVLLIPL